MPAPFLGSIYLQQNEFRPHFLGPFPAKVEYFLHAGAVPAAAENDAVRPGSQ
jgi:hypothetical protein